MIRFPHGFRWGVATASDPIEGAWLNPRTADLFSGYEGVIRNNGF